jgi:hypothetical protein
MEGGCGCGGQRLDAFSWTSGLSTNPYGETVGLRSNEGDSRVPLERLLKLANHPLESPGPVRYLYSLCWGKPSRPGLSHYHLLYSQSKLVLRTLERSAVYRELRRRFFDHLAFTAPATSYLFVRGAVLEWQGQALLLVGRDAIGKSKLARALLERGAHYLSDHFALVDSKGKIHSFPCSLLDGDEILEARDLGWSDRKPLPLGLVASLHWSQGGSAPPLLPMSCAQMVHELYNASFVRKGPDAALKRLALAVQDARGWSGERGESADTAAELLSHVVSLAKEPVGCR